MADSRSLFGIEKMNMNYVSDVKSAAGRFFVFESAIGLLFIVHQTTMSTKVDSIQLDNNETKIKLTDQSASCLQFW